MAASENVFVGREGELALLNAALDEAARGTPRIVSVEGAPGMGKTALLDRFRQQLTGAAVLGAIGEESEAALEFGLLSQLLRAFDSPLPDGLRPIVALRPEHGDPYMVGAGLIEALSDAEEGDTVVLLIDDAQWADRSSLQALVFAFRRMEADRVLLLLSVREATDSLPEGMQRLLAGDRGRRIRLEGLALPEVVELAKRAGRPLRARTAERLHANTEGNPLFVKASLVEIEAGILEWSAVGPLPAPHAYTTAVRARLSQCSSSCRDLVECAAVLGVRCHDDELFQTAGTARPLAALDEAISAGMLTHHDALMGIEVRFVHPLIRAAVYHSLSLDRRAAIHAAAAAAVKAEPMAMRHAALASQGPDSDLATRLEQFAQGQMLNGSWRAAAQALVDAARLSPDRSQQERRQLDAADCYLWVGDTAIAMRLLADTPDYGSQSARREFLTARLAEFAGRALEADARYLRAWQLLKPGEEELATPIAGRYSMLLTMLMRNEEAVEWGRRALRDTGPSLLPLIPRQANLCYGLAIAGDYAGVGEITAALPDRPSDVPADQIELLLARGLWGLWADHLVDARDDLLSVIEMARQRGDARSLIMALGNLADVEYRLGDWDAALMHGELSASTAEDSDQLFLAPCAHGIAAFPHIARGAWPDAERCVQAAERLANVTDALTGPVEYAAVARARLELARRRPALAERALQRFVGVDTAPLRNPGIEPWQLLYAEALHDQGRHEAAARVLDESEARTRELGLRSQLVAIGRLRGQIEASAGRPDRAAAAFESGLSCVEPEMAPYEVARLEVAYGSFLRRHARRRAAKACLESARARLIALRAEPDLQRCETELAGTGLRPVRRTADARNLLTSQELAVARLVAGGLKSREVANELFVSVKTIEYHLGNIYGKLGLTSRGQLMRYMLDGTS